jgi:hypothetical protein
VEPRLRYALRLAQIAVCHGEAATIMPTRVRGTLDDQDYSDTYTLWRRPGQYRFELRVDGEGAAALALESLRPGGGGKPDDAGRWRPIEERPSIPPGSRIRGVADVGAEPLDPIAPLQWVQVRVRISRAVPTKPVVYEFSLEESGAA